MKSLLFFGFLIFILLVSGCGQQDQITGDVVHNTPDNIVDIAKIKCKDGSLVNIRGECPDLNTPSNLEEISLQELEEVVNHVIISNFEYTSLKSIKKEANDVYLEVGYYNTNKAEATQASYDFVNELGLLTKNYKDLNIYLTLQGTDNPLPVANCEFPTALSCGG
jgi:hypothetical protein